MSAGRTMVAGASRMAASLTGNAAHESSALARNAGLTAEMAKHLHGRDTLIADCAARPGVNSAANAAVIAM